MRATRGRAIAIGLLLLAIACESREERAAARIARAEVLVADERVDDALIELRGALKLDPRSAEANQRMAELMRARGAHQLAIHHFGEAYQLDPTRIDAALAQATLLGTDAPERAGRILAGLKRREPGDARVPRAEAALALASGHLDLALSSARMAIALDPDGREGLLLLARVHRRRARAARAEGSAPETELASALEAYAELLRRDPADGEAELGRARVYASWPGRADEAIAAFRSALALTRERGDDEGRRRVAVSLERYASEKGDTSLRREALRHQAEAAPEQLGAWVRLAAATGKLDGEEAALAVYRALIAAWPRSPAAHIHTSSWLARRGRLDAAIAQLDGAVQQGLDDPELLEQLVRLEISRGNLDVARARAEQLHRRHPGSAIAMRADARIALAEGRPDTASTLLDELDGRRENAESEALRAQVELARGRIAEARGAADRAVALAPGFSAPALRLVARVHAEAGAWSTARAALAELERHGLALSPAERLIVVRADYASGDAEAGREALQSLLASPDAPPGAALEFARREGGSEPAAARAHLERALAGAPGEAGLLETITRLDLREGAAPRALDRVEHALATGPVDPRVLLLRAQLLVRAGRHAPAEADALRALEARPDLPEAVGLLLAIYRARGDLQETRRSFEEAEAAGVLHAGARLLLAGLQMATGDSGRARDSYERVLAERPDLASAKNDLAFLLAARGEQLERALGLAEEARRALPDSANVADTVGAVLLRLGRPERATAEFRAALDRAVPGDASIPTFHHHLALALEALGRETEAAAHLEQALALDPHFPGAREARARLAALGRRATAEPGGR